MGRLTTCLIALMLCGLPGLGMAEPLNLRWDACWGDGGVANRSFGCDVNAGSNTLVASLVLSYPLPGVTLLTSRVDVTFAGGSIPDWWQFMNAGSCRPTSLNVSAVLPGTSTACVDWSGGLALDAFASAQTFPLLPGRLGLTFTSQLPSDQPTVLLANREYFVYAISVGHEKTVGAGSCAGCSIAACLGLQYIEISTPSSVITTIHPFNANDAWLATWQGAVPTCPFTTPTRRSTWGSVKSLYR